MRPADLWLTVRRRAGAVRVSISVKDGEERVRWFKNLSSEVFKRGTKKAATALRRKINVAGTSFLLPVTVGISTKTRMVVSETWMPDLLSALCENKKSPTLLDVGVNVGQTLLSFKASFPQGVYRGFEPVPASVFWVQNLIKKNSITDSVVIPAGLLDVAGIVKIYVTLNNPTGSGSTMSLGIKSLKKKTANYAAVYRLDDLYEKLEIGGVDVIKIDVEGSESLVLSGAAETIQKFSPPIIIEILPEDGENRARSVQKDEINKFCEKFGYELWKVENNGSEPFCLRRWNRTVYAFGLNQEEGRDYVLLPNGYQCSNPRMQELIS